MRILLLCAHTPTLIWFRQELMQEIVQMGHEVIAAGPGGQEAWENRFKEMGIAYLQVDISRTGMNPFRDYRSYHAIMAIMKEQSPDKIFTYMSKAVVLGSFAAKKAGIEEVYALIGGLGSIIRGTGIKNAVLKRGLKALYKRAFSQCKVVFFHNDDDARVLTEDKILLNEKVKVVNGSGVNLEKFTPQAFPEQLSFLFIGRLIKDKGIREYLQACKMIKQDHPEVRCMVVGRYDSNPSSIDDRRVKKYIDDGIIEYFPEQDDIRPLIAQSSVFVLPSYHEGRPKSVLEAMAMGRPIITTDVPGCRETVENGKNGYLVKPRNVRDLAEKMKCFIQNPGLAQPMGEASLKIAKEMYDVRLVNAEITGRMNIEH